MTTRDRKHLLLLAIALMALYIALGGCASEYEWVRAGSPSKAYEWKQVTRDEMFLICATTPAKSPTLGACAYVTPEMCRVHSDRTEWQAKREMSGDGLTLWEHEIKHCEGWWHKPYSRWEAK